MVRHNLLPSVYEVGNDFVFDKIGLWRNQVVIFRQLFLPTSRQLHSRGESSASAPYSRDTFVSDRRCPRQFSGNLSAGPQNRRTAIPTNITSVDVTTEMGERNDREKEGSGRECGKSMCSPSVVCSSSCASHGKK